MNDLRHKDVRYGYSATRYSTASPFTQLLFVSICLLAVSLPVASAQTKTSQPVNYQLEASGPEKANKSKILNGRADQNPSQTTAFECGEVAQRVPEVDNKPHIDHLLQSANLNRSAFSCLSSVKNVHERWNRRSVLLIDIRRMDQFQKYQIPGSLNLSPFSIKSKRFLTDKRIVLVNEGRNLTQLDGLCTQLKSAGFQDVSVMIGGLHAWHQAGFPITGDRLELSKLSQISPAELISSLHERDWRFIDLDRSLPNLASLLTTSDTLEYRDSNAEFIAVVNKVNGQFGNASLTGFVVVSSQGDNYQQIEHLLQLTEAKNIFYLSGGISELKRYLNTHSSLISRLAKGFKEPHRCSG